MTLTLRTILRSKEGKFPSQTPHMQGVLTHIDFNKMNQKDGNYKDNDSMQHRGPVQRLAHESNDPKGREFSQKRRHQGTKCENCGAT